MLPIAFYAREQTHSFVASALYWQQPRAFGKAY